MMKRHIPQISCIVFAIIGGAIALAYHSLAGAIAAVTISAVALVITGFVQKQERHRASVFGTTTRVVQPAKSAKKNREWSIAKFLFLALPVVFAFCAGISILLGEKMFISAFGGLLALYFFFIAVAIEKNPKRFPRVVVLFGVTPGNELTKEGAEKLRSIEFIPAVVAIAFMLLASAPNQVFSGTLVTLFLAAFAVWLLSRAMGLPANIWNYVRKGLVVLVIAKAILPLGGVFLEEFFPGAYDIMMDARAGLMSKIKKAVSPAGEKKDAPTVVSNAPDKLGQIDFSKAPPSEKDDDNDEERAPPPVAKVSPAPATLPPASQPVASLAPLAEESTDAEEAERERLLDEAEKVLEDDASLQTKKVEPAVKKSTVPAKPFEPRLPSWFKKSVQKVIPLN